MGRKRGGGRASGSRVPTHSKNVSVVNSDDEEFYEKDNRGFSRRDDDEVL